MKKIIALLFILALAMPVVLAAGENAQAQGNDDTPAPQLTNTQTKTQLSTGVNSVGDMVRTQEQLRAQDMNQFSEQIRIRAGNIEANGESNDAVGKQIQVRLQNREITIGITQNKVQLREGNVVVNASEIQLRNGKMYFGDEEINQTPQQIRTQLQNKETHRFELRENKGKAVYAHEAIQQRKLFGLFSMKATLTEEFDVQTGKLTREAHPWWYAFSSEVTE